jgi:hypothetical protein
LDAGIGQAFPKRFFRPEKIFPDVGNIRLAPASNAEKG